MGRRETAFFRRAVLVLGLAVGLVLFPARSPAGQEITAAVLADFPPLYSLDRHGRPQGLAIDILKEVARPAGLTVHHLVVPSWAQALEAVRSGRADLVPGIGISQARLAEFAFSDKVETVPVVCFVRAEYDHIKELADLKGRPVGVISQSAAETNLSRIGAYQLTPFKSIDSALMQLLAGHVDGFIFPEPVLRMKARSAGLEDRIRVAGKPVMELKRGYLLRKEDTALLKSLNRAIEDYTRSPLFQTHYLKWYGRVKPFWTVERVTLAFSLLVAVLVVLGLTMRFLSITRSNRRLEEEVRERSRAEADLEDLNQELLRSNRELQQFAYVASHDLQEPLRMVASYTQLLARRYRGRLDKDADEFIDFAVDGAKRMKELINDLLNYSRIQTKAREFQLTQANESLTLARENLTLQIQESGARMIVGDLPSVMADPRQLVQLFQNLIHNAIKFRAPERPPRIEISAQPSPGEWTIRVKDNGIGLDPKYAQRIFVVFSRLHSRQEYPGTGMGLAICRRIVERHGGRIWVESSPGEGASFYFTIRGRESRQKR